MEVFAHKNGRRQPDFSIPFENVVFVIVPSCLFLFLVPWRLFWLARQRSVAASGVLLRWKSVTNVVYFAIQLGLLVTHLHARRDKDGVSITASTLLVLSAAVICILSWYEHWKSSKPSSILGTYLLLTALIDIIRVRTLWLLRDTSLAGLLTVSLVIKLVMIVLEEANKTSIDQGKSCPAMDETSGIYSKSLFWWINSVLSQGYRKQFVLPDLSSLERTMLAESLVARFTVCWDKYQSKPQRLVYVLSILIKWHLPSTISARVLVVALNICQPLLMEALLNFLQENNQETNVGYGLLAAFALVYLGMALFNGIYYRKVYQSATTVRGSLIANIYRSTLLGNAHKEDESKALTLISADVDRVSNSMRFMHEFWAEPLQVAVASWLLYERVGVSFVVPIGITLLTTFGISFASRWTRVFQERWMSAIQNRVGTSSKLLASMEALKMTGSTTISSHAIEELREAEIRAGKSFRWLEALTATSAYVPALFSPPITFAVFIAASSTGYDVSKVLTSLSLLQLITQPLSSLFQVVVPFVGALACLGRIESYLKTVSSGSENIHLEANGRHERIIQDDDPVEVELKSLRRRTLDIHQPHQTSRLSNILIEDADIGWIASKTVFRNLNITFATGSPNFVVGPVASGKSTLLKAILRTTEISRGRIFSPWSSYGYCDQKPWLQNTTIRHNIIGYSNYDPSWYASVLHATCLDEDVETMARGDQTLVGDSGTALSGGQRKRVALARAIYSRHTALLLDDPFGGLDSETQRKVSQRVFSPNGLLSRYADMIIATTTSMIPISPTDFVVLLDPEEGIKAQGRLKDLQTLKTEALTIERETLEPDSGMKQQDPVTDHGTETAIVERGHINDAAVFRYYFRSVGATSLVAFLILAAAFAFLSVFPTVWLQWWAEAGNHAGLYLGVYAALQISAVFCILALCSLTLVHMVAKSGRRLHKTILRIAFNASWPSFVAAGSADVLNRLTHDLGIIDSELPELLLDFVCVVFTLIGQAILIARSNWYIAAAYIPLIGLLWTIQKIYLRTSKQLRHLELEAKAPLYRQFTETLSGLATIRAYGWQEKSIATNNNLIDQSQRPYYLLLMVQRWLSLVLDLITAGITILVVGLAIALRKSDSTGSVGVALLNIMSFATYTRLVVVLWSSTETALGAMSRIMVSENSMHVEPNTQDIEDANLQPLLGTGPIVCENVFASYATPSKPAEKIALQNICLAIPSGTKFGICGRSGSGKSSFIKTLLHMLEITAGSIHISNINITTVSPSRLRQSITCVTQDPWFIPGSVAFNLDMTNTASAQQMMQALEKVGLWHIFAPHGLEADMNEKLLSQGQQQLFCLARAIIAPKGIVILDEFTSAVDKETEKLMQEIAEVAFKDCTVIAVAHHLDTIVGYDMIAVFADGKVIEVGEPGELLGKDGSKFGEMVRGA